MDRCPDCGSEYLGGVCNCTECEWCESKRATSECPVCSNSLCDDCIESHEHCIDCGGSGVYKWEVRRNSMGNLDYLNGKPTGVIEEEPCRRCETTGLKL